MGSTGQHTRTQTESLEAQHSYALLRYFLDCCKQTAVHVWHCCISKYNAAWFVVIHNGRHWQSSIGNQCIHAGVLPPIPASTQGPSNGNGKDQQSSDALSVPVHVSVNYKTAYGEVIKVCVLGWAGSPDHNATVLGLQRPCSTMLVFPCVQTDMMAAALPFITLHCIIIHC